MNEKSTITHFPRWIGDAEIDPRWIEEVTSLRGVVKCTVQNISNAGRRSDDVRNGATLILEISFDQNEEPQPKSLVIKQVPPAGQEQSQMLGLAREALFYKKLAPKVMAAHKEGCKIIPKIYHSYGDMTSGSKIVLMEDLSTSSYIDSGILFGPGNPNNWTRDLPAMISRAYGDASPPTSYNVANDAFLAIAKVHATFWKDTSLLGSSYLRSASWIQDQDRTSWEAAQGYIQGIWKQLHDNDAIDSVIEWDPLVRTCLTKAMSGISWEAQLKRLNTTSSHWTLVHGDFWPGNVLVSTRGTDVLKLLDWEMIGLGSGPQDLGQYILSNMDPQERRDCEQDLVENYYAELVRCGISRDEFGWEECWKEYQIGGIERWLWFLVYFIGQEGILLKWAQFFHDQILAFLKDHGIEPKHLVQPRP